MELLFACMRNRSLRITEPTFTLTIRSRSPFTVWIPSSRLLARSHFANRDWSRRGRSCMRRNSRRIGSYFNRVALLNQSRRCNNVCFMSHPIYRVESFTIVGPHILNVGFNDGTSRRIDFKPILQGELFGPLRDLRLFEQVKLDPEVRTLVWPNGADFDPATLHDWPEQASDVSEAVEHWRQSRETVA